MSDREIQKIMLENMRLRKNQFNAMKNAVMEAEEARDG